MKKFKLSFSRKLILIFILVNIPVFASTFAYFYQSLAEFKANATSNLLGNQERIINLVENDITYVRDQMILLSDMTDWNYLYKKNGDNFSYDQIQMINRFTKNFKNILQTSRFFSDVRANIPLINRQVSAVSGLTDFNENEYNNIRIFPADLNRFCVEGGKVLVPSKNSFITNHTVNIIAEIDVSKIGGVISGTKYFPSEQIAFVFRPGVTVMDQSGAEMGKLLSEGGARLAGMESGQTYGGYLFASSQSYAGDFTVYSIVPMKDISNIVRPFYASILVSMALSVLLLISYFLIVNTMVKKPLDRLVEGFKAVEMGDFSIKLHRKPDDEIRNIYKSFNKMTVNLERLISENYVKELYSQKANYKQLQAQINPHFLYNSFFVLHRMIKQRDFENAEEFSANLSKYYKYITKNTSEDVLLSYEIMHTKIYSSIMSMRYGNRIKAEFACPDEGILNISVPRLILQPFIENFFLHGLKSTDEALTITVTALRAGSEVCITISDNGCGIEKNVLERINSELNDPSVESVSAIYNINKRLRIKYGNEYGVSIANNESGGCLVRLMIPYIAGGKPTAME
jgi:two-component system sensor histidine kinase YesM